jgi:hypothetical protein
MPNQGYLMWPDGPNNTRNLKKSFEWFRQYSSENIVIQKDFDVLPLSRDKKCLIHKQYLVV